MSPNQSNKICWICSLKPNELSAWEKGQLDRQAQELGISGWVIPIKADDKGKLNIKAKQKEYNSLPCAPFIELQKELSPATEYKLIDQLTDWWTHHEPLRIWNRPILILEGMKHLSHPRFALKRLHLAEKNLIILSRDHGDILELMEAGFDGQIQNIWNPNSQKPANYLLNLKHAHHNMEAKGCWIPAVQAISADEKLTWEKASANSYQEWLEQATAWSEIRYVNSSSSPVWIESWEGHRQWWTTAKQTINTKKAHIVGTHEATKVISWGKRQSQHIALMIHGFYLDELEDMLKRVPAGGNKEGIPGLDLYLSTPKQQLNAVKEIVMRQNWPNAYIFGTPNRGRDIAPFLLHQLPAAVKTGHQYFVKAHTKRSPHLNQGNAWGDHLITSLINPVLLQTLEQALSDPTVGLLAPKGSVLRSSVELRRNCKHLKFLLNKQEIPGDRVLQQSFIAGSMMAGKIDAIKNILDLGIELKDFEIEQGQVDGTLAHAVERFLSWSATQLKLKIIELTQETRARQGYGYRWIKP